MKTIIFIDGEMAEKFFSREQFDEELLAQLDTGDVIYRPVMIIGDEAFYSCAEPVYVSAGVVHPERVAPLKTGRQR